ncbi:hypothetical protein AX767_08805 [Variovorax sp. PAMC 28711]|nr:hypothetical protein AX767_08805 [Variovorax sp. PAMC 28711]
MRTVARALQWLIVCLLAVCLPLQAASAAVTAMLGARHTHRVPVVKQLVANDPQDPMAGWRDFRRMQYGGVDRHALSHAHAHETGARHHHEAGDASVVAEDASDVERGPATDLGQASASFLFMAATRVADLPPSPEALAVRWNGAGAVTPGNPDPRRIERPPQPISA